MGKLLKFPERKSQDILTAEKLVGIAEEIDAVILQHLQDDMIDPRDLVGLLAHRMGTLMNHLEEKTELWGVCEKVMKK